MPKGEEWRAAVAAEPGPDPKKDKSREAVTTRQMCKYPAWPRYRGTGDVNAASSFERLME